MVANAEHVRVNQGVLAAAEKRLLVWLAGRMPSWINSDHLTLLGLVGMVGAGLAFWAVRLDRRALVAATFALAVNWFGDSLDGTLARVRGKLRPRYGFYVDHVVDVFGAVALVGGMGASGLMTPAVAAVLLLVYLMLTAEVFLATHVLGVFRMAYWRIGPTELRIVLAVGMLRVLDHPEARLLGKTYLLFDMGGVAATVGLFLTLLISVGRNTHALFRAEPLR